MKIRNYFSEIVLEMKLNSAHELITYYLNDNIHVFGDILQ
jgi:hypothetical protein